MFNFNKKSKIFCISFQRNGTTSVGEFFNSFGYKVAGDNISQKNNWGYTQYLGDFEKIFNSSDFKRHEVFEDGPWFFPEFYKQLHWRFPESKFILFKRDPKKWFSSMLSHSNGKSLGKTYVHAKIYRREQELFNKQEDSINNINGLELQGKEQHYINIYNRHNFEVEQFFRKYAPNQLIICDLLDKDKWQRVGSFCNIDVPTDLDIHANKSI